MTILEYMNENPVLTGIFFFLMFSTINHSVNRIFKGRSNE